MQNTAKNF